MTDTNTDPLLYNFIVRPLVGAPVTFLFTCIMTGGVDNAVFLVFVSVVCTAGVGLVVWMPLCGSWDG